MDTNGKGKTMFMVAYTLIQTFETKASEFEDNWLVFHSKEEAQEYYDYLLGEESLWSMSMGELLASTENYTPNED